MWGNLVANVERLDDELFKSLQVRSQHVSMLHLCLQHPLGVRKADDSLEVVLDTMSRLD